MNQRGWQYKILNLFLALIMTMGGMSALLPARPVAAAGELTLTIVAAPNLVVDSNALSPSTYAPKVATVIGKICNTTTSAIDDVTAYIGDYNGGVNSTPGTYPARTNPTIGGLTYQGTYAFTHLGGAADASRFVGSVPAHTCVYQYWSFEYPHLAINAANGATIPTWGVSVKPDDDLSLSFDMWVRGGGYSANASHTMTMRNEISAMANKIKPNGNPPGEWFNTDASTVYPGQIITTNGIDYRLGNINQGFDNNGDGVPDYNAWLQPFGDPAYDPSCFRLIGATGVLTVTRGGGNPDLIIPIDNSLYFTNIPSDNTDVRGRVYYQFLALGGPCTVPISPYQEVASGSDNEKFNGDYGTGVPALMTYEPEVIVDKTGDAMVAEPGTITYSMPFYNNSDQASAGLTLSSGGVYAPLTIQDLVPAGLQYLCGSANVINRTPNTLGYVIRYSKDSGATWGSETATWAACSTPGTAVSPDAGKRIALRFELTEPLPKKTGSPAPGATATFQAQVPGTYTSGGGSPLVENCAKASFGDGAPFAEECASTLVEGTGSIGDRVWQDENRDGNQTGELGISGIKVSLYYDKNGDGKLDNGDVWLKDQDTSGTGTSNYNFTQLPAGKYIVKVDTTDGDLPTGYGPTTATTIAVTLTAGQTYPDADFGFGPSLRVDKHLDSLTPAYVGETVTFHIDLVNRLPGDGSANGFCIYNVWAGAASTGSPPKDFANVANAVGAPNLNYAVGDFANGSNKELVGSSYSSGGRTSGISKVEVLANVYFDAFLTDDDLTVTVNGTTGPWSTLFTETELNAYAPAEAKKGNLVREIPAASAPGGSWDWSDFAALSINFAATKSGGADTSKIYVDALGFRVTTTDASCGNGDTTIAVLPLTDTYDSTKLTFLSADPAPTTQSDNGSTGTLTWENLGPLYAGGTRSIVVNFTAKATIADPGTTNTASVTGARFSSGRSVNDASDTASVPINTSYSISGYTWVDANGNGWSGTTGYDTIPTTDQALSNVKMDLYVCANADGTPIAQATSRNSTCGSVAGESWKPVKSTYTNSNGYYLFDGLRPGYYNVQANGTALPTGMTTRTAEATGDANGAGAAGGNGEWNDRATVVKSLHYLGSSTSRTMVNFGYRNATNGTVTGYVWQDSDKDNVWDSGEMPIPGVTATLYRCDPNPSTCTAVTNTTTDNNGYYQFSNVTPTTGNQTYKVVITPPNGMAQSGDPDGGACYGGASCDSQTTTTFTLAAGAARGPYYFGYTGGYTIGDTVYTDWNGNGAQNTGEEGLGGVKVRLYRDLNANGVVDTGDTLLATRDTLYTLIAGSLDINNDGVISETDDKTLLNGYRIIDGKVDINGDGFITDADDGTFAGYPVLNGLIDHDSDGDTSENASLLGFYQFTNLPGNGADYLVMVDPGTLPAGYTQTADRDSTKDNKTVVKLTNASVDDADFGYQPRGYSSIGDTVWNDANANGVQETTENGINGVTVALYQDQDGDGVLDPEDALVATTLTGIAVKDGYLDLDGDGTIADADDDSPALLGIRVMDGKLDMNNDGVVTSADTGTFAGYPVIGGLLDMNRNGAVSTDDDGTLNGLYQFRNLAAGTYIVDIPASNFSSGQPLASLLQTYDQDSATVRNNQDAVTLGANENYVLGDFGYTSSAIGDLIWQDNNGDGIRQSNEPGIQNVRVELYLDANNDGTPDGTAIATTTTDANGLYLFGGLGPNNYLVKVADSNFQSGGALYQYTQTYDPNAYNTLTPGTPSCLAAGATLCDNTGWLKGITAPDNTFFPGLQLGQNDLSQDFGYKPPTRTLGDTLWIDGNGNNVRDAGEEGLPYVTVQLCASTDPTCATPLQTTDTDENGNYTFAGLANNTTCYVKVLTTDPDFPAGLTPTYDLDGADTQNITAVAMGTTDRYDVDFGYRFYGANRIHGTAWYDADKGGQTSGIGDIDDDEKLRYGNVPVYLWSCVNGCGGTDDILVASTTTAADGTYAFPDLANGTYRVSLNGNASAVAGMTSTTGTSYSGVTLSGGTVAQRDFGFFAMIDYDDLPDSYGTTVANNGAGHVLGGPTLGPNSGTTISSESNGQPGPGASSDTYDDGIILGASAWTAGTTVAFTAKVNGANGYLVGWFDWNGDGKFDSSERVTFGNMSNGDNALSLKVPADAVSSGSYVYMRFRLYDKTTLVSISPTGLAQGGEVEGYRHSWTPTAVDLVRFEAAVQDHAVLLTWETAQELDNLGFNLYRGESAAGPWTRLNAELIPAQHPGATFGATYTWLDEGMTPGATYFYRLEDVNVYGASTFHGPISITAGQPSAATVTGFTAHNASGLSLGLLLAAALTLVIKRRR